MFIASISIIVTVSANVYKMKKSIRMTQEEEEEQVRLVDAIHSQCSETKTRCVLFIVGGGSLACGWLFGRPGASSWLLEARIPYGNKTMRELFTGKMPGSVRRKFARPSYRMIHSQQ